MAGCYSSADPTAVRPPQPGPSSGALFAELMSRCRDQQGLVAEVAREAQKILDRYEEDARDAADRLMIDARLEAARLQTDARRELDTLNRQIDALHEAQREASLTLEQTRRALDAAL